MHIDFAAILDRARSAVWVLPAALLLLAAFAGVVMPIIDREIGDVVSQVESLTTTPDGARTILSTIAGSTVTVAGVVFSVTMVMLSIASSQFGSRVLRNRMRERSTQVAIGTLLGTTIYCLLVLRSVSNFEGKSNVPHVSVAISILMVLVSLLVVVFFLREMSTAIQAPYIVASVAGDLDASIDRLFPEKVGLGGEPLDADDTHDDSWRPPGTPVVVASRHEGYIQTINGDALVDLAKDAAILIQLRRRPGDFLAHGIEIALVWGVPEISDDVADAINAAIVVGATRTPWQDVNCSIHELSQVAVRALSPGINDPFTAMNSIDRLGAALMRLAERKTPSRFRYDDQEDLRIVASPVTFPESLAAAFNQIRHYASDSAAVSTRLMETLEYIAQRARREGDQEAILTQARLLVEACEASLKLPSDRDAIRRQMQDLAAAFPRDQADEPPLDEKSSAPTEEQGEEENDEQDEQQVASAGKGEVNG